VAFLAQWGRALSVLPRVSCPKLMNVFSVKLDAVCSYQTLFSEFNFGALSVIYNSYFARNSDRTLMSQNSSSYRS
jgi:hypothetical protein